MIHDHEKRLVVAFERIAAALERIAEAQEPTVKDTEIRKPPVPPANI